MRSCSAGPGRVIDTPPPLAAALSHSVKDNHSVVRRNHCCMNPTSTSRDGEGTPEPLGEPWLHCGKNLESSGTWHTADWCHGGRSDCGGGGEVLMLRLCGDSDEAVCVSNTLKDGWAGSQPGLKILSRPAAALQLAFSIYKQRRGLNVFTSRSTDWEFLGWKCHPWTHMNLLTTYHVIFSFSFVSHTSSNSVR